MLELPLGQKQSFQDQLQSVILNMKGVFCLIIFSLLLITTLTRNTISLSALQHLKQDSLSDGQLIEVTHTSDASQQNQHEKQYYVMRAIHRDKRTAYHNMQQMFERVVRILIRCKVIPDSKSLVQSKIKPQYLPKKRKWSFTTIFVILGNQIQLRKCYHQLFKIGIQKLNAKPSINFLNEKIKALEVFAGAKARLQAVLKKRFPGFDIMQVERIDLEGVEIPNSDMIERQIEEEFSDSDENMEESKIKSQESSSEDQSYTIHLKVVFEVSRQIEEDSDFDYYDQDSNDSYGDSDDDDSDVSEDDSDQDS